MSATPRNTRPGLTALIPTFNCEQTIEACLESLRWADKFLIVDSFSTDRPLELCRRYTDKIVQHEYVTSARQKNWALPQVTTDWVLQVDSDEVIETALAEEITAMLTQCPSQYDGYRLRRKNLVWKKWVKVCANYLDWQLRLFKADRSHWTDREVHAHIVGPERVGLLQGNFVHCDVEEVSSELSQFARQVLSWELRH